jgi:ATP-dependent Clp protease ATP-binding subunit ClpB
VNRIDEIVVFNNLEKSQIKGIADIQIKTLTNRLKSVNLGLSVSDEVFDMIVDRGYDPVFGARPLKRSIQQLLENPLSQKILHGDFEPGSVINATSVNGEIVFN